MNKDFKLEELVGHAKEYGFVFPSSEIYDGLNGVYDYGQNGVELRNNIKSLWWSAMIQSDNNIVGIDSSILMHPKIWKASGHVDSFSDPMIDNKDSKKRYRADVLIEEKAQEYEKLGNEKKATYLYKALGELMESENLEGIRDLIMSEGISCPVSKTTNWTDVRQFNLMFSTQIGSVSDESSTIYLRPETAQGIFVNFLNVQKSGRLDIPFGICQIGKAFRNEIVARQFVFRMKEFEQMEMQYFVQPGEETNWFDFWKQNRMDFYKKLGFSSDKLKFKDHDNLAHYASDATDIQFKFPFGFKELEGIHSRSDFDLSQHQKFSGKKMSYFDTKLNKRYVPYVVETSVGPDRLFLAVLTNSYTKETIGEKERVYLNFHPVIAPKKAAILPLVRKGGLPEMAKEIYNKLKFNYPIVYDEKGSIGKRYTKQDLIGTPFCFCIDFETIEDQKVTVRDRNTLEQLRIPISSIDNYIRQRINKSIILE